MSDHVEFEGQVRGQHEEIVLNGDGTASLRRFGKTIRRFVPSESQMRKIRSHHGTIYIYRSQIDKALRRLGDNPISTGGWLAIGAVVVIAGGVGFFLYKKNANATSSASVTLQPGSMQLTGITPGSSIALALPGGATWLTLSVDGHPALPSSAGTYSFTTTATQGTITASWRDVNGNVQNTAISYGA